MSAGPPWWSGEAHALRRPGLLLRGRIVSAVRAHFEAEGFIEVSCGALQVSPGNETHLHAYETTRIALDGARDRLFLHTSPEFAMKKLLAAGERKIFDMARVYRNREAGPLNVPEFTLLEWYRAGAPYESVMRDALALVRIAAGEAAQAAGGPRPFDYRGRTADPFAPPQILTVAEAFETHAGIDLLASLDGGIADSVLLGMAARKAGVKVSADDTWSDIFSRVLSECIEPHLGVGAPTLLTDYPATQAALAKVSDEDPRIAERFELYVCGVELANGFGELTDAGEQRRRFEADMDEKERIYGERYPLDETFLDALAHMPPASGVALGLDRLVMLAAGAQDVRDVMWTPPPEEGVS